MENPYRKKLKVWPAAECTLKVEQSLQKIMSGLFVFEAHDITVSPERTLLQSLVSRQSALGQLSSSECRFSPC